MRRTRIVAVLLLGACLLAPVGAQVRTDVPYRILVSNDDGVNAPGLAAVAKTLQAIGEVTIVAPSVNQSGKGHSIVTSEPVFRQDLTLPNGLHAIGLTATPATTVNIAIRNIVTPSPDLVVSGINFGYNLGYTNYVSGTVGAARQAAILGIPAIAASLSEAGAPQDYGAAAEEVLAVARRLKQFGIPKTTFLTVNIPARPAGGYKGYRVTSQASVQGGVESFAETKDPRNGSSIYWNIYKDGASGPEGSDVWAVANGYVSITPMKLGESDAALGRQVEGWFK